VHSLQHVEALIRWTVLGWAYIRISSLRYLIAEVPLFGLFQRVIGRNFAVGSDDCLVTRVEIIVICLYNGAITSIMLLFPEEPRTNFPDLLYCYSRVRGWN
jgi:hypothetical protein